MKTHLPREIAERYRVSVDKVLAWIRSGELVAIDVSTNAKRGKPRWRISEADLATFEARRTATPPSPKTKRRRRRDPAVIEYF